MGLVTLSVLSGVSSPRNCRPEVSVLCLFHSSMEEGFAPNGLNLSIVTNSDLSYTELIDKI